MSFAGSFQAIAARYGQEVILFHQGQQAGQGLAVLRPVLDRQAQWQPQPLGQARREEVLCLAAAQLPFHTGCAEQTVQAGQALYDVVSARPVEAGTERIYWRAVLRRREEDAL